jgi:hypothetical protein
MPMLALLHNLDQIALSSFEFYGTIKIIDPLNVKQIDLSIASLQGVHLSTFYVYANF